MLKQRAKPKPPETPDELRERLDELLMLLTCHWLLICRGHIQRDLSTFDDVSNLCLCVCVFLCVSRGVGVSLPF